MELATHPIVLVPGLLCDRRVWAGVEERLQDRAIHVDLDAAASLQAMADDILAVAPARFVLAGFSMGAMAALLAAAAAPQRIASLLILATHAERDPPERRRARLDQIAEVEAAGLQAFVTDRLLPLYFEQPQARAEASALVLAMALRTGPAIFRRHVEALADRPDLASAAAAIRCPCDVLAGEGDRVATPRLARRLAELIPGARLQLLTDCGHMAPLDRPDAVARHLRELAGLAAVDDRRPARAAIFKAQAAR